ncbi:DUF4355 domain-containing protein [Sporolactobacillus shoreicorticis]|uniref:DUF4355 domain-containing protein n=1 Tax=Sporolactobacillus shoreicorticis TaxID=1923877 RepID=A0ABW5S7D6_9BACL|nr:DUF4355 domain-containing protein [Sporolactobacillus shoreicorticis]MCO7127807.1 DUF4355 domain-containing protein [Sporolactobacillus shoreicorticis]
MKTMTLRYPLNLQYFAERNGDPTPDGATTQPSAGDPPATPQTPPTTPTGTGNGQGSLTLDSVQKFLNESEDGKKWLNSFADSRVTQGINTFKEKSLPEILEKEIAKRYPAETPAEKALRELKQKFEDSEKQRAREALKSKALTAASAKGLPTDLVDFFLGNDEEATTANLSKLEATLKAYEQKIVNEKFKQNGTTPPASGGSGTPITLEDVKKMSAEEINKHWDEVQKLLKQ